MKLLAKLALLVVFILGTALGATAQSTVVSATVLDPTGAPYVNGSFTAQFYDPGTSGKIPLINGSTFQTVLAGQLDSFGKFSTVVARQHGHRLIEWCDNTTWSFSICSQPYTNLGGQKFCFSWTAPAPPVSQEPR